MDPISLALLGSTILSVGGSIFSANRANRMNRQQSDDMRAFQQYNADTTHQRAVDDLRKAGLNPVLAAGSQNPAPGGAKAEMEDGLARGIHNALEVRRLKKDIDLATKSMEKIDSDMFSQTIQNLTSDSLRDVYNANAKQVRIENEILEAQKEALIEKAKNDARLADWDSFIDRAAKTIGIAKDLLPGLKSNSARDVFHFHKRVE